MKSYEIRESFLSFFSGYDHYVLEGASLIPSDPTVLFTLAGMLPLKPFFTGERIPVSPRLTSCQRCFRTNDIENVGKTNFHHTLFEMLGNFSIGDYFKESAIPWAYEYLTKIVGLPVDNLIVTVHPDDEESITEWKKIGFPHDKILPDPTNFWMMGEVGPCGPDSEIHFDWQAGEPLPMKNGEIDYDHPRFVELWNIVFTQFDAKKDGSRVPLPRKNIDTGAGLERITAVSQGVKSSYETDLFLSITKAINSITKSEDVGRKRMIADHTRAVVFLIGDGVFPANDGRGYVMKRLVRRSLLAGRQIGIDGSFISKLADTVINEYKNVYPYLLERRDAITKIIGNEEKQFLSTLEVGLDLINTELTKVEKGGTLNGKTAFKLYDTFGFPVELTAEYAGEKGIHVDMDNFQAELAAQRERGRRSYSGQKEFEKATALLSFRDETGKSKFDGFEKNEITDAKVFGIMNNKTPTTIAREGDVVYFNTDKTPFYPEKGGQIGDCGTAFSDSVKLEILDTRTPIDDLILHKARVVSGELSIGDTITLRIDEKKRQRIINAHTATHLLHFVLKSELGDHANQAGSWVGEDELRFDFTTTLGALNDKQLKKIESEVNSLIWQGLAVTTEEMSIQVAKDRGAVALFGEKYGDFVRVVSIGETSQELCGGCHVSNTSHIGFFKITSESSIGSNLRRITAITNSKALEFVHQKEDDLLEVAKILGSPIAEIKDKAVALQNNLSSSNKQIRSLTTSIAKIQAEFLKDQAKKVGATHVVVARQDSFDMQGLRMLADFTLDAFDHGVAVLLGKTGDKCLLVAISKGLPSNVVHCGKLIGKVGGIVGFKGGGRSDMGQAGGIDPAHAGQVLTAIESELASQLTKNL